MDPFTPFNSSFVDSMKADGTLILKNVRLSYPKLFKAVAMTDANGKPGAPRFGAVFICNFTQEQRKQIGDILIALAQSRLGEGVRLPSDKYCARRGDDTGKPENAGCMVITSSESAENRPTVINRSGRLASGEAEVYAGCMVDAIIRPWVQNNGWGKRVNSSLVAVRFVADNTPFGAPPVDVAAKFGLNASDLAAPTSPDAYADPGAAPGFELSPEPPTSREDDNFNPFG